MSAFGVVALTATFFYPYSPRPGPRPLQGQCEHPWLARIGLTERREEETRHTEERADYGSGDPVSRLEGLKIDKTQTADIKR